MPLSHFSTAALLAEIRRREQRPANRHRIVQCDECEHFIFADSTASDSYNPCKLGHHVMFRVPRYYGDEWGYYRPGCKDRVRKPAERAAGNGAEALKIASPGMIVCHRCNKHCTPFEAVVSTESKNWCEKCHREHNQKT